MDFNKIQQEVLQKASTKEGEKKIQERNDNMVALKKRLEKWASIEEGHKGLIRRRKDIMFAVSQTRVRGKELIIGVELNGKGIGELRIDETGIARFSVKPDIHSTLEGDLKVNTSKDLLWSHHKADGEVIRELIGVIKDHARHKIQEREIQWNLFHALIKKGANKTGEGFLPVLLGNYPSEIPTWMNLKGDPAKSAGNIDILVRGRRPGKLPPFYAFEVKRPSNGARDQSLLEEAVEQGFKYALALFIEANGFVVNEVEPGCFHFNLAKNYAELRSAYRWLFGARGNHSDEELLQFGVVGVLADMDVTQGAMKCIQDAWLKYKDKKVDRFGVLTYKTTEDRENDFFWNYRSWK